MAIYRLDSTEIAAAVQGPSRFDDTGAIVTPDLWEVLIFDGPDPIWQYPAVMSRADACELALEVRDAGEIETEEWEQVIDRIIPEIIDAPLDIPAAAGYTT
jgi:hypothetical protein